MCEISFIFFQILFQFKQLVASDIYITLNTFSLLCNIPIGEHEMESQKVVRWLSVFIYEIGDSTVQYNGLISHSLWTALHTLYPRPPTHSLLHFFLHQTRSFFIPSPDLDLMINHINHTSYNMQFLTSDALYFPSTDLSKWVIFTWWLTWLCILAFDRFCLNSGGNRFRWIIY